MLCLCLFILWCLVSEPGGWYDNIPISTSLLRPAPGTEIILNFTNTSHQSSDRDQIAHLSISVSQISWMLELVRMEAGPDSFLKSGPGECEDKSGGSWNSSQTILQFYSSVIVCIIYSLPGVLSLSRCIYINIGQN